MSLESFKGVSHERRDLKGGIKERGRQLAELVARRVSRGSRMLISRGTGAVDFTGSRVLL